MSTPNKLWPAMSVQNVGVPGLERVYSLKTIDMLLYNSTPPLHFGTGFHQCPIQQIQGVQILTF